MSWYEFVDISSTVKVCRDWNRRTGDTDIIFRVFPLNYDAIEFVVRARTLKKIILTDREHPGCYVVTDNIADMSYSVIREEKNNDNSHHNHVSPNKLERYICSQNLDGELHVVKENCLRFSEAEWNQLESFLDGDPEDDTTPDPEEYILDFPEEHNYPRYD